MDVPEAHTLIFYSTFLVIAIITNGLNFIIFLIIDDLNFTKNPFMKDDDKQLLKWLIKTFKWTIKRLQNFAMV